MRRSLIPLLAASAVALIVAGPATATPAAVQFQTVETPAVPQPGELVAVATLSPTDVWAVGDAAGEALIEHWDGGEWSVVPSFTPGDSSVLLGISALSATDIWAVGAWDQGLKHHGLIEHWDGFEWRPVATDSPQDLNDVDLLSPTEGWVVGGGPYLAHWDGVHWNVVSAPAIEGGELHQVVTFSATDAWAVGAREVEGGGEHDETMLLHWDGSLWSLIDNPVATYAQEVWAVDAISPTDIWAVGEQETRNGQRVLTLHYDGVDWSVVPARNPGEGQELVGVVANATNDVWAVGTYKDGTTEHPMAQHWNGFRWRLAPVEDAFGSPAADSLLAVDASDRGNVWAVGLAGESDEVLQPLVERAIRT